MMNHDRQSTANAQILRNLGTGGPHVTAIAQPCTGEISLAILFQITSDLVAARTEQEAAMILAECIASLSCAEVAVLLIDPSGALSVKGRSSESFELTAPALAAARWASEHRQLVGDGTNGLPDAGVICFPLEFGTAPIGVLLLEAPSGCAVRAEHHQMINAVAGQAVRAITRARSVEQSWIAALRATDVDMRNSLLSSVSHDLRTPLAVITGASTVLRDDQDRLSPAQRTVLLGGICQEAERMDRMVANLLDIARIESRSHALKREWLPLEELVGSALTRLERTLRDRNLTVSLAADLPLIFADPVLFERVLVNLLDNALKYTPPGSPLEIRAGVRNAMCEISVADRGSGLAEGSEDLVFEKYYRGAHSGISGIGMGLFLCRLIVQAHGGTLTAENRPGGGAVFRIVLSCEQPPMDESFFSLDGAADTEFGP